jgi:hypothetical protein
MVCIIGSPFDIRATTLFDVAFSFKVLWTLLVMRLVWRDKAKQSLSKRRASGGITEDEERWPDENLD